MPAASSSPPSLNIHIQVNTSGEASKSGVSPGQDATDLCKYVIEECPFLKLTGLMTIGAIARSRGEEGEENEDFRVLREERDRLESVLGVKGLELSMGMSEDFEEVGQVFYSLLLVLLVHGFWGNVGMVFMCVYRANNI